MRRRRFLAITAAAGALAAHPARAFALDPVDWRGTALGATARLTIHHEDRAVALALLQDCLAEIERLERVFSLYRPESALVALNRAGRLAAPPLDLVAVLGAVDTLWRLSDGAFDPTVQPLWDACARHFAPPGADPAGPALADWRERLGWDKVRWSEGAVDFTRPGMALTLNGIAPGHVTDRVAALLRNGGMTRVLVDLGEIRAVGGRTRPWRIGLPTGGVLAAADAAIATSAADGTRFSPACHHLFDPAAGRSAAAQAPVTIRAATATVADGVSTACAVAPRLAGRLMKQLDCVVL